MASLRAAHPCGQIFGPINYTDLGLRPTSVELSRSLDLEVLPPPPLVVVDPEKENSRLSVLEEVLDEGFVSYTPDALRKKGFQ